MKIRILTAAALGTLAACANQGAATGSSASAGSASATAALRDASGQEHGQATATQASDGVRIDISASGVAPGPHGLHIHSVGRCDAPDFTSAGPHWNPTARQHGKDNPQGMHVGDLPNLTVGEDGAGSVSFTIAGASLRGGANPMLDADGAALVIHAGADDYKTDPSGNSGGRIICGVFG